jgi:hypothetical protein
MSSQILSVESVFSHGSIMMHPHRAELADTTLSQLIFVECNILWSFEIVRYAFEFNSDIDDTTNCAIMTRDMTRETLALTREVLDSRLMTRDSHGTYWGHNPRLSYGFCTRLGLSFTLLLFRNASLIIKAPTDQTIRLLSTKLFLWVLSEPRSDQPIRLN